MTKKKPVHKKSEPMPSLVYNEGILNKTLTAPADQIEKELPQLVKTVEARPIGTQNGHDATAQRWMWFGVVTVTMTILALWAWSLSVQWSDFKWSGSPEKNLVDQTINDWQKSFHLNDLQPTTNEELKTEVKASLAKLLAASATTSTGTANIIASTTQTTTTSTSHN